MFQTKHPKIDTDRVTLQRGNPPSYINSPPQIYLFKFYPFPPVLSFAQKMTTTFEYPLVIDEATHVRVSVSDKENTHRASRQTTLALEGGNMKGKKRTLTLVDGGKLGFYVLDACKKYIDASYNLLRLLRL